MDRPIYAIIIMLGIVLTILGTTFYYVGRKLFRWLCICLPDVNTGLFIIIPAIIALSFFLSFLPINPATKKFFVWFNFCFVGVVLYFLLFFLLSDIVLLLGRLSKIIPSPLPQNIIKLTGFIIIACVTAITAAGIYNGKQLKQASYNAAIEKESALTNLNIVLIADTHLGHLNSDKWLAKIVEKINAANPDIVVIAGDVFNDNFNAVQNPAESIRIFQKIRSTYGVYACMGNHDGGSSFNDMLHFLEQGGVTVLQDEHIAIEEKFTIIGRTESSPIGSQNVKRKELSGILAEINTNLPVIVIDHNPVNVREYGDKIDLLLSGHTHKGQIFPANIITNLMFKEINYGYSKKANSPHVVVTSGTGLWGPPLRIGTNNEVVSIKAEFSK